MLRSFILLLTLLKMTLTWNTTECNSIINTSSPDQCIGYSGDDFFCCHLYSLNGPSDFKVCNAIPKNRTITLKTVGSMQYTVNCTGITNYYQYFPFEQYYQPCGIQDPDIAADCGKYSTDDQTCCLASTDDSFNLPLCYYYGKDVGNFTDAHGYYFTCSLNASGISISYFLIMFILLLF
jgi:hypothetical protein